MPLGQLWCGETETYTAWKWFSGRGGSCPGSCPYCTSCPGIGHILTDWETFIPTATQLPFSISDYLRCKCVCNEVEYFRCCLRSPWEFQDQYGRRHVAEMRISLACFKGKTCTLQLEICVFRLAAMVFFIR